MNLVQQSITVEVVNAFVDGDGGGNPAGVVLDADNLSLAQKLAVAKAVGLSETAFVSSSELASFKLDFFTPTRQIAHCGHATVGVFSYLAETGVIRDGWYSKETIDGNRKILIKDSKAYMEQLAPKADPIEGYRQRILDSLNLADSEVAQSPMKINTGNSFVILGVRDAEVLARISPQLDRVQALSDELDLIGFYVFTTQTRIPHRDASSRMFAPRYGISEEAATGMAAGPLACYLYEQVNIRKRNFELEQGEFMPKPSASVIQVELELDGDEIVSLMAGGSARVARQQVVNIELNL